MVFEESVSGYFVATRSRRRDRVFNQNRVSDVELRMNLEYLLSKTARSLSLSLRMISDLL